jgi:hypothetical protein
MQIKEDADNLPLVERFHTAEYLARELSEHLRQAFLPKLSDLRSSSKIYDKEVVTDQAMLDKMNSVLQAEEFANDVFGKLSRYLESIERDLGKIYGVGTSEPAE